MTIDQRRAYRREIWKKYHDDRYRKKAAEYMRLKRATDPDFAIAERLRARIKTAIKRAGGLKASGSAELTGCTKEQLRSWIESQFVGGMSWDNRSEWHIDHIIPCAAFHLTDESQQAVAFHYTNLRPLWKQENQRKRDSVPVVQRKMFWTLEDVANARKRVSSASPATAA